MARAAVLLILILLLLTALLPAAKGAVSSQSYANRILTVVSTPQLVPGGSGPIEIMLYNPFNSTISTVSLRLTIYSYASTDSRIAATSIPSAQEPGLGSGGLVTYRNFSSMNSLQSYYVNFTVHTTSSTRHGDFFNVGTYYVSTYISFNLSGSLVRMASEGTFTSSQWSRILVNSSGGLFMNYTYLNGTLGFQGITPDTSFTVNTPSPLYLIWISGGLGGSFAVAAFLLYRREKGRRPK